jgi:hypothetical protein
VNKLKRPIALGLFFASAMLWMASRSFFRVDEDSPNCISARCRIGGAVLGALSHAGQSTLFVTRDVSTFVAPSWSERADGHFCGFSIPPKGYADNPPDGLTLNISASTLAWTCPYWLICVVWATAWLKSSPSMQLRLIDLFAATTWIAVLLMLVNCRLGLLAVVPLNLATAIFLIVIAVQLISATLIQQPKSTAAI